MVTVEQRFYTAFQIFYKNPGYIFCLLRELQCRLFTVDDDIILIIRFWQVLLSGGTLKLNHMNVPGKTTKDIKDRLEWLRKKP